MTPTVVWQTWKSKKLEDVPTRLRQYVNRWKKMHPSYEYHLLDDNDLRNIVKKTVPEYLSLYDSFTHIIERVDFARYAILYECGGVYADLDTNPLKSVDEWVKMNKIILGCEPKEHAQKLYSRDRVLCNAFMISPPKQKFWLELMKYIAENYEHRYKPVTNTGPMAITHFLDENPSFEDDIIVTHPCVFYPIRDNGEVSEECDITKSYVEHVWNNSWTQKWYQDPILFNTRYWVCGLLILFLVLWCWIYIRRK